MRKIYNKLVRDKIPDIIRGDGKTPEVSVLQPDTYIEHLRGKLREETEEFLRDDTPEELCDILEVVYAIAAQKGITVAELERMRRAKAEEKGAFRNRILLMAVTDVH